MKRLLFIALLVVFGCEDKEKNNNYVDCADINDGDVICFSLKDLNPNSSTVEKILSPADFLGDICIIYFGHES